MTSVYLPGPTICGLYGMFDSDYGDPASPKPYPRVTPSRVGSVLLPFHCARCESTVDFSDRARREHFHDTRVVEGKKRDNYFCPSCGLRFLLNPVGQPLRGRVGNDGAAASTVEQITVGADGLVSVARKRKKVSFLKEHLKSYVEGTDVLGSC